MLLEKIVEWDVPPQTSPFYSEKEDGHEVENPITKYEVYGP
jgi:hypothetical protein